MVILGSDPEGTFMIVAKYDNHRSPKENNAGCGDYGWVNWDFELAPAGHRKGPCPDQSFRGYLVQKVTTYCVADPCKSDKEDCSCPKTLDDFDDWMFSKDYPGQDVDTFEYYEAWEVDANGKVLGRHYDDKSKLFAKKNSCGFHNQIGELRYYCRGDIDMSVGWQAGNPNPKDNPGSNVIYGTKCPTTPGSLPSSKSGIGVWEKPPRAISNPTEESGTSRMASMKWNCCGKQKDMWTRFTFAPNLASKR
jgi:hypothetical protein